MDRLRRGLLLLLAVPMAASAQPTPIVAAASDLKFALDDIAQQYQRATGQALRISYGSSGNFFRQIVQDAPFELFMSADEGFVFSLADRDLTPDRGTPYAIGRVVLFSPAGSALVVDDRLAGLVRAVRSGLVSKFAIANPEHAPYGRAAMQALQQLGIWNEVQPRLVLGENVSQAAQFAVSGSAQGGIFAYSLALAPMFAGKGKWVLVPQELHEPLRQRMVLTRKATPAARQFYDYLQQPQARAVFRRYGFALPGEAGQ